VLDPVTDLIGDSPIRCPQRAIQAAIPVVVSIPSPPDGIQ